MAGRISDTAKVSINCVYEGRAFEFDYSQNIITSNAVMGTN